MPAWPSGSPSSLQAVRNLARPTFLDSCRAARSTGFARGLGSPRASAGVVLCPAVSWAPAASAWSSWSEFQQTPPWALRGPEPRGWAARAHTGVLSAKGVPFPEVPPKWGPTHSSPGGCWADRSLQPCWDCCATWVGRADQICLHVCSQVIDAFGQGLAEAMPRARKDPGMEQSSLSAPTPASLLQGAACPWGTTRQSPPLCLQSRPRASAVRGAGSGYTTQVTPRISCAPSSAT